MIKIDNNYISTIFKPRAADSNKGTHGHALLIAGAKGKIGAAVIAARACLRSGAGLLTVNIPVTERSILQTSLPEAMLEFEEVYIKSWNNFDAVAIGPGIGTGESQIKMIKALLGKYKKPVVIDADALNIIARNKKLLDKVPASTILTPHVKEFDRLFGEYKSKEARVEKAVKEAAARNIIIVLKDAETFVTNGNESYTCTIGNAGLAKGGSGDCLTGMILAFLAQKYSPLHAALLAVYLHGAAADITLQEQSVESMLITDVIENIGKAFSTSVV